MITQKNLAKTIFSRYEDLAEASELYGSWRDNVDPESTAKEKSRALVENIKAQISRLRKEFDNA